MAPDARMEGGKAATPQRLCSRIAAALEGTPQDVLLAATQELSRRGNSQERGTVWVTLALRALMLSRAADALPPAHAVAPKVPVPEIIPVVPVAEIIVPPPPPRKRATPLFSNMALDQAALLLAEMNDDSQAAPSIVPAPLEMPAPAAQDSARSAEPGENTESVGWVAAKPAASRAKSKPVVDAAAISASFDALFEVEESDSQDAKAQAAVTDKEGDVP